MRRHGESDGHFAQRVHRYRFCDLCYAIADAFEAVAIDPVRRRLYLTEDQSNGRFYRHIPMA